MIVKISQIIFVFGFSSLVANFRDDVQCVETRFDEPHEDVLLEERKVKSRANRHENYL